MKSALVSLGGKYFALAVVLATLIVGWAGTSAYAAQELTIEQRIEALERQNQQLTQTIQELQQQLQQLKQGQVQPPTEEMPDIEDLLKVEPAAPQSAGAVGQAGGDPALNPLVSFTFDYVANALDRQPAIYDADMRQRRRVLGLRGAELNAKRGVSVYGDAFITFGDHGKGPELEEGYIDLNRLFDRWNIRFGRWRIPFGPYNGVHEHQLPCVCYPRTVTNFFGFHGAAGNGLEVTYLPKTSDYTEIRLGGYSSIGSHVATAFSHPDGQTNKFSYSGHFRYNRQLSPTTDVDFTASYLNGPNPEAPGTRTGMTALSLQWRADRGNHFTDRLIADWVGYRREMAVGSLKRDAWSLLYLKQLGLYNECGALYENAAFGDPAVPGRVRAISGFYTYKPAAQQEFRLQYRHSNYPTGPDTDELLFQSVWSIGNHSHEFK